MDKEELKANLISLLQEEPELLKSIKQTEPPKPLRAWTEYSRELDEKLDKYFTAHKAYQLKTAICTILRFGLQCDAVGKISQQQLLRAREIGTAAMKLVGIE